MARTANPNRCIDVFKEEIHQSLVRYRKLETVLSDASEPDEIKKGVAEDAAFRLGVLWETFQGDWHLAAISRDPRSFVGAIQGQLNVKVNDPWARSVIETIEPTALTVPKHPSMALITKMVDPQGFNVTFSEIKGWTKDAEKNLADNYRARVNTIASDHEASSLLHLVKKMRNLLAHGSASSQEEFRKAVRARAGKARIGLVGTANVALQRDGERGVTDVGAYLRAKTRVSGARRLEVLHTRVSDVAEILRV